MNYNRVVCFDLEMCCWNENGVGTTGEITGKPHEDR